MKRFLFGVLCCLSIATVQAQSNVIKMIVAFPPGGPVDSMARSLVEPLGKDLNAQIVIENKELPLNFLFPFLSVVNIDSRIVMS